MKLRIHEGFHGVGHIFGGEGRAIGEMQAGAEMKFDGAAVGSGFPGSGERGLESLGLAIEANQNAAGKVANDFGLAVFNEERIERFRFAVDAKMEFAAGLRGGLCDDESRTAQGDR
jgi:hypothetical protein